MKRNIIQCAGIAIIILLVVSCKKQEDEEGTKAVFSYVTDGFVVNFTNFSTKAKEYLWDFGDGSGATSNRRAPQHIYNAKGDYLVTLTVKDGEITSTFKDTVTIVGPNIKIDGDFSDWEHVDYTIVNDGTLGGNIKSLKTFASGPNLHFLLEGTTDMTLARMAIYFDTDNNSATGYAAWQYPAGSGANYKIEGSITDGWGGLQQHSGNPADGWGGWSSDIASFPEVIVYSPVKTVSGKNIIEFSVKKEFLGSLGSSFSFCIIENSVSYTQIGAMPANQFPTAKFGVYPL